MPPDGCPAAGGISSEPLNGALRKRDLNTPTAGLDRGRRARSNPPGPVRAACGELRQIRGGSIPSWGLWGERIILTVNPGSRETPPAFYGPKRWKSLKTIQSSHTPGPLHSPFQHPTGKVFIFLQYSSTNVQ